MQAWSWSKGQPLSKSFIDNAADWVLKYEKEIQIRQQLRGT